MTQNQRGSVPQALMENQNLPVSDLQNETQIQNKSGGSAEAKPTAPLRNSKSQEAFQTSEIQKKENLSVVQAQFDEQAAKVFEAIPTVEELRKLPADELHETPEALLNAGVELGALAELVKAHPELSERALEFYEKCSLQDSSPMSVRAVCYSDFKTLAKRTNSGRALPPVPEKVRSLAEQLN